MPKVLRVIAVLAFAIITTHPANAEDKPAFGLSSEDLSKGWIALFDGETTFGWKVEGPAKVEAGQLVLGGDAATTAATTTEFGPLSYRLTYNADVPRTAKPVEIRTQVGDPKISINKSGPGTDSGISDGGAKGRNRIQITVPAGCKLAISRLVIKPEKPVALFNGKDLAGWKQFKGDPKREISKFDVTKDGELRVVNGPGDLQTEKQFADFVLQYECKTNGKGLNSGIFFRCIANEYQNGYEAQIQNLYANNDRTKPVDFGTGAIYRRIAARKVMANDNEWFATTVVANGAHISTWVNGYQTVDWTDDRKPDDNPRKGLRTAAGHLSIQGHDPTTDILFRNIRATAMSNP